jgi:hypothetical protein
MTCSTLLNAIFAVSSRHLSTIGEFDQYASDRYHQECLKQLSTIAGDDVAIMNDDFLAATILLRTLEELDGMKAWHIVSFSIRVALTWFLVKVPLLGFDHQGHLLGIQVFMNAQDPSSVSTL